MSRISLFSIKLYRLNDNIAKKSKYLKKEVNFTNDLITNGFK